jgi:hypothetical protein
MVDPPYLPVQFLGSTSVPTFQAPRKSDILDVGRRRHGDDVLIRDLNTEL